MIVVYIMVASGLAEDAVGGLESGERLIKVFVLLVVIFLAIPSSKRLVGRKYRFELEESDRLSFLFRCSRLIGIQFEFLGGTQTPKESSAVSVSSLAETSHETSPVDASPLELGL